MKALLITLCALFCAAPALARQGEAPPLYTLSFAAPGGETLDFEQFRGRVVLVNFWATWCPPCVREMPALDRLQRHFAAAPFEVVAISVGEDEASLQGFVQQFTTPLQLQFLLDPQGSSFTRFELRGLPTSYLFDHRGQLVEVIVGDEDWDSAAWRARIEGLLQAAHP